MRLVEEIMTHNQTFVAEKKYEGFRTTKFPDKKIVIITCMDTRLVELLPQAMNIKNGDAKIIKSAGANVHQPFGSVMRSVLVAIYSLNAEEVCVIGHSDCGVAGQNADDILHKARQKGISDDTINTVINSGINLKRWLSGFNQISESVLNSVDIIRRHPLMPTDIPIHGLIIDSDTGRLDWIYNGYEQSQPSV